MTQQHRTGGVETPSRIEIPVGTIKTYRLRLVKHGPWVPAAIGRTVATDPLTGEQMDRSPILWGVLLGEWCEPEKVWPRRGPEIGLTEYRDLLDRYRRACAGEIDDPIRWPYRPVTPRALAPAF